MQREKIQFNNVSDDDIRAELGQMNLDQQMNRQRLNRSVVNVSLNLEQSLLSTLQGMADDCGVKLQHYMQACLWAQVNRKHLHRNELSLMAERLVQVFRMHHVSMTKIPALLPDKALTVAHWENRSLLLNSIEEHHIGYIAALFGVRSEWLRGEDDCPYAVKFHWYRNLDSHVAPRLTTYEHERPGQNRVLVFTSVDATDQALNLARLKEDYIDPLQVSIAVEKVRVINGVQYVCYEIWHRERWNYAPARRQLKAILLFCHMSGIKFAGYRISDHFLSQLEAGKVLPAVLLQSKPASWNVKRLLENCPSNLEHEELEDISCYIDDEMKRYLKAILHPEEVLESGGQKKFLQGTFILAGER